MTDWVGGNLEEMTRLAEEFHSVADELKSITQELGSVVAEMWWKGGDADKFRSDWDSTHKSALSALSSQLESAQDDVRRQIEDQRRVSEG